MVSLGSKQIDGDETYASSALADAPLDRPAHGSGVWPKPGAEAWWAGRSRGKVVSKPKKDMMVGEVMMWDDASSLKASEC